MENLISASLAETPTCAKVRFSRYLPLFFSFFRYPSPALSRPDRWPKWDGRIENEPLVFGDYQDSSFEGGKIKHGGSPNPGINEGKRGNSALQDLDTREVDIIEFS